MEKLLIPLHVTADTDHRINLQQLSDHMPWLSGTQTLDAWLLLVELGQYRLLQDDQVQNDPLLAPVRLLILEGRFGEPVSSHAEQQSRTALVARLVPTTIKPPDRGGAGWRLLFPRALDVFAPADCDKSAFSILFTLEGFWEIWYTDVLRKVGVFPLRKL